MNQQQRLTERLFRTIATRALVVVALFASLHGAAAQSYDAGQPLYVSDYQYASDDAYVVSEEIPDFNSPNSLTSGAPDFGYLNAGADVGSNAWLDSETNALFERNVGANGDGIFNASSGNGTQSKKVQSRDIFGYAVETNARDGDTFYERWIMPDVESSAWTKQFLPVGTMYPSYLAGRKESRLQSIITYEDGYGTLWDITLGGRAPIFRYGTTDIVQPEGWQLEIEGAALLRLDWERHRNLAATDYRAGVPLIYGTRRWQFKTGYYHVSSHLGDNYLMDDFRPRKHYSRDSIMFGLAFKPTDDVRLYAEVDYAFHSGHTTEEWEFQFGAEYTPQFTPMASNWAFRPFLASHGHLYEERDFGGYWATQAGLQWRSPTNSLLRLGVEYFMGGDDLYQFHTHYQRKIGGGIWYDF
ncbi:MAG: DUF1207 domain-containing protein [Thermoguttaceae bacterium]|jgi:hypothetical protein